MPRRRNEMISEALNTADEISSLVAARYPDASPEWVDSQVARATLLFATLRVTDAIDDLGEVIRAWTP